MNTFVHARSFNKKKSDFLSNIRQDCLTCRVIEYRANQPLGREEKTKLFFIPAFS